MEIVTWKPEPYRDREDYLRHNYLARPRKPARTVLSLGEKIRAGLGYPPTVKLIPGTDRPWSELGR